MPGKQKILVTGDVAGKFKTLFGRVTAINEKSGPFDFLFCVGDFFGESPSSWEPYKNGSLKIPVPTYILGPNTESQATLYEDLNGCEMCPNVNYLGKRGILSSSGLSIAYLSGLEGKVGSSCRFSKQDVRDLKNIVVRSKIADTPFLGIDILLTTVWPKGITELDSKCTIEGLSENVSEELAWLATELRPRYHFSAFENIYYERPPYENYRQNNVTTVHCTRFVALAKVGSTGKNKWLYAVNVTPIDDMSMTELYQATTDQTPCPLYRPIESTSKQYFYDMNSTEDLRGKRKRKGEDFQSKKQSIDQDTCWFCLASPKVEKHLVISIGEQVYLALAKGGLTELHVMIIPVQHHRSYAHIGDDIRKEVKKFKSALKKFFKTKKMVPVYFERNYKTCHMQLHAVPILKSISGRLLSTFQTTADEQGLEISELPDHCKLVDTAQVDSPYFYAELPTSERLFGTCKKNFPLEFARDVLASDNLLDMPHRVSWRECVVPKTEETKMAENFRSEFKEFDFTNEGDDDSD